MSGNFHFRAQRPMNTRTAMVHSNRGYGSNDSQQYPRFASYQNRGPKFTSVYQNQFIEDFNVETQSSDMIGYSSQHHQQDYQQLFEDDSHFTMPTMHSSQNQRFSTQGNQSARFSQRNATTGPSIRHPTPAAHTSNQHRANKSGSVQSRSVVMLPPPKPQSATKRYPDDNESYHQLSESNQPEKKIAKQLPKGNDPSVKRELFPYEKLQLLSERFLLVTIPQLFKWKEVRHKQPPIFETVGTLIRRIETVEFRQRPLESHFSLRNLSKWQERGKSMNQVLDCVIYSTGKRRYNFSVDIHIRVVGRFLHSGLFHCIKARRATESDVELMTGHLTGKAARSIAILPSSSGDSSFDDLSGYGDLLQAMSDDSLDPIFKPF